ncbi:unnamed protein product [marine sediment metagenome]|uniref:Uncharacterized protein n=1 Tax=marine sediment metagenome TaxID=412755 RepID=X1TCR3_9ZZZZ
MEEKTKCIWIPNALHNILKHRATDNHSTIEKELIKILKPELQKDKSTELLKREKINDNT